MNLIKNIGVFRKLALLNLFIDISFFDATNSGELTSRLTNDATQLGVCGLIIIILLVVESN
jgi:ABC-type multidrug transport system fused ATPase/permease subunit